MGKFLIRSPPGLAFLSLLPAQASAQPCFNWYPQKGLDGGWFAMIFGPIFMLVPLIILIVVVVLAARWAGWAPQGPGKTPERTPLDILKERFARGEIDKEEFDDRRRALSE
jgi:putative membrane protein